jgi:hypothetical protein
MPERVRLRRTAGWRMPAGTVKVDRSTRWGNPWRPEDCGGAAEAVARFRAWLEGGHGPDLTPLRGKRLACWCAPGAPCHADVLIELANG